MEKIYIDTLIFNPALDIDYNKIIGMFSSEHIGDCCEWHELDFEDVPQQFLRVEEELTKVDKIEIKGEKGMGITLFLYDGEKRVGIFIPGRGSNNGYYSDDLTLIVTLPNGFKKEYDITEYQDYE